jgi:hypothetical protein
MRDGRWKFVEEVRDRMMKEARAKGMNKLEAREWAYSELDRLYPPAETTEEPKGQRAGHLDSGGVRGLGDVPEDWPELPDNASLAAEIGWCQAQRLRIVEENSGGATVVHLDRARSPAPPWAALGWLETSVRSYAKYVDVVAKSLGTQQDEAAMVRRERLSIEDMREILAEMHQD